MIESPKPVLFDCVVSQEENVFPMIPSGAAHNEMLFGDMDEGAVSEEGKTLV